MHSYPLKFKTEATPARADLTIFDAEKNEILFRPKITEPVEKGQAPCVIFSKQPLYSTLLQKKNGVESYLIKTSGEPVLGELVVEAEHAWKVMDKNNNLLANFRSARKPCCWSA